MELQNYLKNIPNFQDFSRKSKILLLSYYLRQNKGMVEFSAKDVRSCCSGLLKPPSQLPQQLELLSKGKKSVLMKGTKKGLYSLAIPGLNEVETYFSSTNKSNDIVDSFLADAIPYLKKVISKVGEENKRKFMAEAVSCLGVDARRATIIMVWGGTIDHLYDFILSHKLGDFNTALHARSGRESKLTINIKDDFSDIREGIFIEICRSARIISNDVRKILDEKLGIRNSCAHPSNIEVHPSKVVNFIEDLVDNIILKYSI